MKVLVTTDEGQGKRKSDFAHKPFGVLAYFPFECDRDRRDPNGVDGSCGCRRAFAGIGGGTSTTAKVEERDLTVASLADSLAGNLVKNGWYKTRKEAMKHALSEAKELARLAAAFPVGGILEKRGDEIVLRK